MYSFHTQTDTGLVRPNNEDALGYDAASGLAVLADGMGGHRAGEVASRIAVDYLIESLGPWLAGADVARDDMTSIMEHVDTAVQHANERIRAHAAIRPECAGMGTTLVMGVLDRTHAMIAHAGDSRCYRLRNGVLSPLTRDHSIWQEQRDQPEASRVWRTEDAGVITRALGVEPFVCVDYLVVPVLADDLFMFCSDGLTDMVAEDQLQTLLRQNVGLDELCRQLVEQARYNGGRDNISVLLARRSSHIY